MEINNNDIFYEYARDKNAINKITDILTEYCYELIIKVLGERHEEFINYIEEYETYRDPIDLPLEEDEEFNNLRKNIQDWSFTELFDETLDNVIVGTDYQTEILEVMVNNVNYYISTDDSKKLIYKVEMNVKDKVDKYINKLNAREEEIHQDRS